MPQVTRSTSTPVGYVIATMQAQIDAMVVNMNAGQPILAADVAALVNLYNDFVAHYHTASDLRGVDTYPNLPVYGAGTYVTSTSTTPTGKVVGSVPPAVTMNGEISAADLNTIIGYINNMRVHVHDINDVTS